MTVAPASKCIGHSIPTSQVAQATSYLNPTALGLDGELISPLGSIFGPQVRVTGFTSFMLVTTYSGDIAGALFGIQLQVQLRDPNLAPAGPVLTIGTMPLTFASRTEILTWGYGTATAAHGYTAFDFQLNNLDDAVAYTVTSRLFLTGRM